jgi:hypothetical protein
MTNALLTKKIIALHEQGYEQDFQFAGDDLLICMQTNKYYDLRSVSLRVEDKQYDFLSHSFQYLHTIETGSGEKGILLTAGIMILSQQKGDDDCSETGRHPLYAIN